MSCLFHSVMKSVMPDILGMILQWVIVPSMGKKLIPNQDGAGGLTARNGGVPKMHTQTQSTVSATCTAAATVQESLWNHKP